jgi:hypothetical protein
MPRFPQSDLLHIPATFVEYIPGRPHPDGRRYLPLLLFDVGMPVLLGVVDRHHRVDPASTGERGSARLVFLLSDVALQAPGEQRQGIAPEQTHRERASMAPEAWGRVVAVPTWEEQRGKLAFESLYTELLLDIGLGIVGVRTATTAESLKAKLGKERIEAGDWLRVGRSRIDILEFVTSSHASQPGA